MPLPGPCPDQSLRRPGQLQPANFENHDVTCVADRATTTISCWRSSSPCSQTCMARSRSSAGARPEAVFGYAQVAMQRIYHAIIAQDLLPKILHPRSPGVLRDPVRATRAGCGRPTGCRWSSRMGRSGSATPWCARTTSSTAGLPAPSSPIARRRARWAETRLSLRETWLVQWSQFFKMPDAGTPNLSRRISPTLSALDAEGLFKSTDGSSRTLVAARHAERRTRAHVACRCVVGPHPGTERESDSVRLDVLRRAANASEAIHSWLSTLPAAWPVPTATRSPRTHRCRSSCCSKRRSIRRSRDAISARSARSSSARSSAAASPGNGSAWRPWNARQRPRSPGVLGRDDGNRLDARADRLRRASLRVRNGAGAVHLILFTIHSRGEKHADGQ